jgi:hypothetical protein
MQDKTFRLDRVVLTLKHPRTRLVVHFRRYDYPDSLFAYWASLAELASFIRVFRPLPGQPDIGSQPGRLAGDLVNQMYVDIEGDVTDRQSPGHQSGVLEIKGSILW